MKPTGDPEIYTPQDLQAFFGACKPDEHLRYSALREPAFHKGRVDVLGEGRCSDLAADGAS
jgi:hypothetical protein